jgi:hypothetical protein
MKHIVLSTVFALAITGCTTNGPLRSNESGVVKSILNTEGKDYQFAFVEFGEQGSFQDTTQLDKARLLLQNTPGKVLLVMYLHGWHNNAKSKDVERFERFLAGIARFQQVKKTGFHVVGVYLGWRGESLTLKGANVFTIWDRKRAAERLASNNDCLETISSLSAMARIRNREDHYVVLLGHSLGGLVLERAVAHSITAAVHSQAPKARPADLIITLNPASDSILTRQMVASLRSNFSYKGDFVGDGRYVARTDPSVTFPGNQQVIVALSAENDRATGGAFPAAMGLSALTKQFNKVSSPIDDNTTVSERGYYTTSPGNKKDLITHRLRLLAEGEAVPRRMGNAIDENLSRRSLSDGRFVTSDNNFPEGSDPKVPEPDKRKPIYWRQWQLTPEPMNARTPYWIVQVPTTIIDNHGDIWSDNAQALMAAIFRMNFPFSAQSERGIEQTAPAPFRMPVVPAFKQAKPQN